MAYCTHYPRGRKAHRWLHRSESPCRPGSIPLADLPHGCSQSSLYSIFLNQGKKAITHHLGKVTPEFPLRFPSLKRISCQTKVAMADFTHGQKSISHKVLSDSSWYPWRRATGSNAGTGRLSTRSSPSCSQ